MLSFGHGCLSDDDKYIVFVTQNMSLSAAYINANHFALLIECIPISVAKMWFPRIVTIYLSLFVSTFVIAQNTVPSLNAIRQQLQKLKGFVVIFFNIR